MRSDGGKRRRSLPAILLIALGVLAQLAAAFALINVDAVFEYATLAPEVSQNDAQSGGGAKLDPGIEARIEALEDVRQTLGDGAAALSMYGAKTGATISFGGESAAATLNCVEPSWLEVCPRRLTSGRWMDAGELQRGAKVAALDEDLAFELFGSEEAEGQEIVLEGERYRVIGVVRHRRSAGEADEFAAYLPLRAAMRQGIQLDALVMRAMAAVSAGLGQSLEGAARDAWGPGELHDLQKERMGALLTSRLVLSAFALALILLLGKRFAAQARRWKAQVDERQSHTYLRGWLGMALLRALGVLLCAALLLAGVYATLRFAIEPVYRFTEWVPESLVSVRAIRAVFWNRVAEAARPLQVRTSASARIAFWGAMDRAGVVAMLLGLALGRRKLKFVAKAGNQTEMDGV